MKKVLLALILVAVAVAERLWFDLGPNIELITLTGVIASIYLGRKWGLGVAVLALVLSDLVIGNTMILVFTWSALGMIAYGGRWLKGKAWWVAGGYGLGASLWFYFYTNFGVWLIGSLYPHTFSGLVSCYVMGLPFLRLQAMSNLIILPVGLAIIKYLNSKFWVSRWKSGAVPQL